MSYKLKNMNAEKEKGDFKKILLDAFKRKKSIHYKKGQILTREGCVEKNLFFIEDGAVKVYYPSEVSEHIIRLGYKGAIVNALPSFYSQKPSELIIETIRETKLKVLKRSEILHIVAISQGYQDFLEKLLVQQVNREIDLLQDSPKQRIERVLKRSPQLFQHVPLRYIASYLRMSPETLSRIRNS